MATGSGAPTSDIGRPDLSWGTWGQGLLSEWLPWFETAADLIWPQSIVTYGRMRNDPQLKAVIQAYLLPLLRANWCVDGTGCRDEVVKAVSTNFGLPVLGNEDEQGGPARRGGIVWNRHLKQALNYLVFGHMPFEIRYAPNPKQTNRMDLANLGQRMPWTIAQMHIDQHGMLDYIEQNTQRQPVPANRLLWYVNELEGSNWAGQSMLRPAFGAWLLKHETWRVHATSIRRFGMGVPTVTAPQGGTAAMVTQAQQLAANMRVGDSAGIGLPSGFTATIQGMTGSVPDALAFISYLDTAMAKMALAGLIDLGQTPNGSRALGETFLDLFLLSLQAVAEEIATTATSGNQGTIGAVQDFVDQNWGTDEPVPRIVCVDVGSSHEVTAQALEQLTATGALSPDANLDAWIRRQWKLPVREGQWVPTSRGVPTQAFQRKAVPGAVQEMEGQTPAAPPTQNSQTTAASAAEPTRKQQQYLAASRFNAAAHQSDWEQAMASLLLQYREVLSQQRTDLVDRVIAAMQAQKPQDFALPPPPSDAGQGYIQAAMVRVAEQAAEQLRAEAAEQGVTIDMNRVKIDYEQLSGVADARARVAASVLAQQAGSKALQVYDTTPQGFIEAADEVDRFLAGLSNSQVRDQLGAALTAAQNAGRFAVLEAAPESAGTAVYVAAEVLDRNTCDACKREDGTQFDSLTDAERAYPTGGYLNCQGQMRCRGTVVPVWGGNAGPGDWPYVPNRPEASAGDADPKVTAGGFNPAERRDRNGKWTGLEPRDGLDKLESLVNPETGRRQEQTPSQFTHPFTGHKMGKTEIGDTFEALFEAKGAHLLSEKFPGQYERIAGAQAARNVPLDFHLDHTYGGELKTLNAAARNQKTAIKAAEVARKQAAARKAKLKPLLVVQVVDPASGRVEVYYFPEFASKSTKAMTHLGGYSFGPEDFTAAQKATGHWDQRQARAYAQVLGGLRGCSRAAGRRPD